MIKQHNKDRFNFFVPLGSFEKANVSDDGKVLMRVKGIASTIDEDTDGEYLDPTGMDCTELLSSGMANWNHQASKTSSAICGIPVGAKIVSLPNKPTYKGLELEIDILNNTEGRSLAELIETLDGHPTRKIGLSIEGRKVEVDPFNSKKVTKAKLSGVAFTHVPKNKNTFVSILKGEYAEPFVEEPEEDDEKEKAIDTEAIAPATPESVEHDKKKIINNEFGNFINKSDIYISFLRSYPQSIAESNKFYSLVQEVHSKMFPMENNGKVSPEALAKAFDLLNEANSLLKSNDTGAGTTNENNINKSEGGNDTPDEAEVEKAKPFAEMLLKAGKDEVEACDTMSKGGIALNVAQGAWASVIAAANAAKEGDKGLGAAVTAPIMKSEEILPLISTEISKSLEPVALQMTSVKDAFSKALEGYNTIIKSLQDQNTELAQANSTLNSRLGDIEKELAKPLPVKSYTNAAAVERFFEKSQDAGATTDENCFNITSATDLDRLKDKLFAHVEVTIEKGGQLDPLIEATINSIEINRSVPQIAYQRLAAMGIKLQAPDKQRA